MNTVAVMGRLTNEPLIRTTQNGKKYLRFSIAVRRKYQREGGPDADFINCVAWEHTAEFISKYFRKGSLIAVMGRIETRTYEDDMKQKRYVTEIICENVFFTGERAQTAQEFIPTEPNLLPPEWG